MKRRTFLYTSLLSGPISLVRSLVASSDASGARPNVVIILADDLGWADVRYQGSEIQTPNIDRLAGEGVRLERFYSYPLCSPTRSALMTGRCPMRLGIAYTGIRPFNAYGLPLEEHLMPQSFQAAGYQTAIIGKWHLGHSHVKYFPNSRGFDYSYGHLNGFIDYYTHERDGGLDWHRNGKTIHEKGYSTDLLADDAIRVIRERRRGKPLFLYLPFNAPHSPLQAPQPLVGKYANISDPKRRTYAAMVDSLDAAVGRVLKTLDEERMTENTLVFFFSDNGGQPYQGGRNVPLRGGKVTTYEGGIRVPAIIRWPAQLKAGATVPQVLTVLDLFPTLAAAAGVRPQNKLPFDGKNLWPSIISGKAEPREDLFFVTESMSTIYLAVFHDRWKLVQEISRGDQSARASLFRINEDPYETNDLSEKHPDVVRDLVGRIEKWRQLHPPGGVRVSDQPPPGWKVPKQWAEAAGR